MRSPFPGMDPYIESAGLWPDFHHELITDIKRGLARSAPARYVVRTGERSYLVLVESEGKVERAFVPDVSVRSPEERKPSRRRKGGGVAVAERADLEPVEMRAFITEEHREAFVEIYLTEPEQRLVTTVEVLSPANKKKGSTGWEQYLRKRQSLMLEGVNLVEIDLLRGGERMPMLDPWPDCPYTLLLARARQEQHCKVWKGSFEQPLPKIPVPLDRPDPDLFLELQPMIDAIYEGSRYGLSIDYMQPASPPLTREQVRWLKQRLAERPQ